MKRRHDERSEACNTTSATLPRKHFRWIVAVLAATGVVLSWAQASLPEELHSVGDCTPGESQCQVNRVAVCECYEEWREAPDGEMRTFTVCRWEYYGELCTSTSGRPADCTPNRRGAEVIFAGGEIKTCRCNDEDGCFWQ